MTGERKVRLAKLARGLLRDAMALIGVGLVAAGGWMVYRPAGLIIPGIFLVIVGVLPERSK